MYGRMLLLDDADDEDKCRLLLLVLLTNDGRRQPTIARLLAADRAAWFMVPCETLIDYVSEDSSSLPGWLEGADKIQVPPSS